MPTQKIIQLYTFDELSAHAKNTAREWYRAGNLDYEWWDFIYEDAERIGLTITEFDLGGRKHIKGHLTDTVNSVCSKILTEHGKVCDTYTLAEQWAAKSAALQAAIDLKYDDEANEELARLEDEQAENESEFEHALLEAYFSMLNNEYEYLNSDEQIDEFIRANEYTFTENGERED